MNFIFSYLRHENRFENTKGYIEPLLPCYGNTTVDCRVVNNFNSKSFYLFMSC